MSRPLSLYLRCFLLCLLLPGGISYAQVANFGASVLSGCDPLVVNFIDSSTGPVTSYSWNLGNSTTSTLQNPSTTYSTPGSYTVTLTVTGPGGTNTLTRTGYITVYDKPAVSFTATSPVAGCTPHNVQFSSTVTPNSPGTATYSWDFGDGNTGAGANPSHTYTYPGTYPVSLTVTNAAGCTRTVTRTSYITAHPLPVGGFTATQTTFCSVPSTASFTSTSFGGTTPYAIGWDFGDGGKGSGSAPSHVYSTGGGFTVTMIVTDARGCADTVIAPAYISVNATTPTFTAPANICVAAEGTWTNTTPGSTGTSWDFDDGSTGTGTTVTHVYASSGTYTVKMTAALPGCQKTVTKTIIVHPKPTPAITQSPSIPCPAPVTVTFAGSSSTAPIANYQWTWYNGGTATGQTVSKNYLRNSFGYEEDTLKLIATTAMGCVDSTVLDTILIRDIITGISASSLRGCINEQFSFSLDLFTSLPSWLPRPPPISYPFDADSWYWDFGDSSPASTSATPSHKYSAAGDYHVSCIITTPNGCTDTGRTTIHVDTPVHPDFIASPLVACPHEPIILINTTDTPLVGTAYLFVIVDDTAIHRMDTSRAVTRIKKPGTYTVRLVSDHGGCIDTFSRPNYINIHPPGAKFTDSVYCSSPTVKFINTSIAATSQVWDFGDGTTDTSTHVTHAFPDTGTYTVTLIAYNNVYGCHDTFRRVYTLFKPFIHFTQSDTGVCAGSTVQFDAAFTGAGSVRYSWKFDNYQTPFDTLTKVFQQYTTWGFHDVTLYSISGNGCLDSVKRPRAILVSKPMVNFGAYPPVGCEPLPVLFRDSSLNAPGVRDTFRRWTFGDYDTATARNDTTTVNHHYAYSGNYTVTLLVADSLGCTDSLTKSNYVGVYKPQAIFTASDDSVCVNGPVIFTSTSSAAARPLRHQWDFGDGTGDTARIATHRYLTRGAFSVRLIVKDSVGCSDTLDLPYPIQVDAPEAIFTMSDSLGICPPLQVTFSNHSLRAVSYLWDLGTGAPVIVPNPVGTFNTPGLFAVRLVTTDIHGCTDTAADQIRVLGYGGAFTYSPLTGCAPLTVNFTTPITGVPNITWDFDDGVITTGSATTTSHTYQTARAYLPRIIFSDGASCSSSSSGLDTIRADKVSADFRWSVPCVGSAFTLNDSSTAVYKAPDSWAWYFGGGDTAAGTPASYTFATAGNHAVTMVAANANGCRDTVTKDVFIHNLPLINVTNDTGVCPGDRVDLLVRGGIRYSWSPAPDSMHNCPVCDTAFVHLDNTSPGISALYTATGVDSNGCVNKDSVRIRIQLRTEYSVGAGGEICLGDSVRLHAQGAQQYEWMPAESLDSPFIASPLASPQRTTTYIVAAREGSCDVDSQRVTVVVHSRPLFSAGNDETIGLGSAVTLQPTRSGIVRIEWKPDTTLSCWNCFDPAAHPYYTRTYYATGYNEFGCWTSDSVTVHVRCNESLVFIPNTFTPNGDGLNDYFFPHGEGVDRMSMFRIFNRWGELLFERANVPFNDPKAGWDGTFKGKALPPDTYVYTIQTTCRSGEILQWKGDITIMR